MDNRSHIISFYTKELDKLKQELDKEVRYYQASSILSMCKGFYKDNDITREELLIMTVRHRECINW